MIKKIPSNLNGMLEIKENTITHQCFFHVDGDLVTIIPCSPECRDVIYRSTSTDAHPRDERDAWLYGVAEDGSSVSFFQPNDFSVHISSPRNIGTARFHAPVILKSISSQIVKLDSFDAIEFRGGVIDLLHMTGKAVDERYSEKIIKFNEQKDFTQKFSVNIDGNDFDVIYTIDMSDFCMDTGKIPDLKTGIHSVLRFEFTQSKPMYNFQKYYNYALRFLQFCSGRMNVNFDVRLYKWSGCNARNVILTRIVDGFDDYAEDNLDIMRVIRFDYLGEKFPEILKVISEENTSPYVMFLPKRNKHVGSVYYTDVLDLCVSLENEYDFTHEKVIESNRVEARKLANELNNLIDSSEYIDYVKGKAKNLINGNLPNLKPSLREKIVALYEEFSVAVKELSEPQLHVELGVTKQYSVDEFKKMIRKFIEIRNHASHAGIAWNEGVVIFPHLCLLVYLNVFKRAGYDVEESQRILSYFFGRSF